MQVIVIPSFGSVVDDAAPTVTATGLRKIWPPFHEYVTRTLDDCGVSIADPCQGVIDLDDAQATITCVTSDEPENAWADGITYHDMVIVNPTTVRLRAERSGLADGRVYTIHFTVTDASGNVGEGVCTASVPLLPFHSAVDSRVRFTVGSCD